MSRVAVVIAALLAACAPSARPLRQQTLAERADDIGQRLSLASVIAYKDAAALRGLLHGGVVDGGLWFDDAGCERRFAAPRTVPEVELDAFASCVAALHVKPGDRVHAMPTVAMLTYGPGIELQAWLLLGRNTNQLLSIGFAADEDGATDVAVTPAALEPLRLTGERTPSDPVAVAVLDRESHVATDDHVGAQFKVCVDASGVVTRVLPYVADSPAVGETFAAAIRAWRFRPFELGGKPTSVCALEVLSYPDSLGTTEAGQLMPPPLDPSVVGVPIGNRISGETMVRPPDDVLGQIARHTTLVGAVQLCVDATGRVAKVKLYESTGLPAYDERILAAVRDWRYQPAIGDGHASPACTMVQFNFMMR